MKIYSGQKFAYNTSTVFQLLEMLEKGNIETATLAQEAGMGIPKANSFVQYMRISDVIDKDRNITEFGNQILKIRDEQILVESLIYYKLSRGWEQGGHLYFSRLANNILYDFKNSDKIIFNSEDVKEKILEYRYDVPEVQEDDIKGHVVRALNTVADEYTGFGNIGLVRRIDRSTYEIGLYRPHYLVCAYILYDKWDSNTSTMDLDRVLAQEYGLRRLFLLDEDEMYNIFSELNQKDLIKIEIKTGLKQIMKNPNKTANDIMMELCNELC